LLYLYSPLLCFSSFDYLGFVFLLNSRTLMCGQASNYWSRSDNLKFMYAQLMTSAKCESKGFGIGDFTCRLCQNIDEHENLRQLRMNCKVRYLMHEGNLFMMSAKLSNNMRLISLLCNEFESSW